MEGISTIIYHGKQIYIFDFTNFGKSKEETVRLIDAIGDEYAKNPLNSVLALIDVTHAFFHFDTFKTFKKLEERSGQYEKKVAIIGLKGLKKAGFTSVASLSKKGSLKAFDSEQEAKEWLVSD